MARELMMLAIPYGLPALAFAAFVLAYARGWRRAERRVPAVLFVASALVCVGLWFGYAAETAATTRAYLALFAFNATVGTVLIAGLIGVSLALERRRPPRT